MKYKCMVCGEVYDEKSLPIIDNGDGCCTIGSLIEIVEDKIYTIKDLEEAFNAGCDLVADSEGYSIEADVDYEDFEDWLKKHKYSDKKTEI